MTPSPKLPIVFGGSIICFILKICIYVQLDIRSPWCAALCEWTRPRHARWPGSLTAAQRTPVGGATQQMGVRLLPSLLSENVLHTQPCACNGSHFCQCFGVDFQKWNYTSARYCQTLLQRLFHLCPHRAGQVPSPASPAKSDCTLWTGEGPHRNRLHLRFPYEQDWALFLCLRAICFSFSMIYILTSIAHF